MAPSKFALKDTPYTGRLSERESTMLAAVFQVAFTQMGTPMAEDVVSDFNSSPFSSFQSTILPFAQMVG